MFETVPERLAISDHVRATAHYDRCKIFIDGVFEIANNFQLSLTDMPAPNDLASSRHAAFRAMLGLVSQNLRSLLLISKAACEGFVEDIEVITRVMYERHISLCLIGKAPETRGPQYLQSVYINEVRWLDLSKSPSSKVRIKSLLNDEERIRREAREYMRKYFPKRKSTPQYWHGMSIAGAAKEAGLGYQHEVGYGYLCEFAHAQGYSIPSDPAAAPSELAQNRPPDAIVEGTVSSAIALFLRSWAEVARCFQPGELDHIRVLLNHYGRAAFPGENINIEL